MLKVEEENIKCVKVIIKTVQLNVFLGNRELVIGERWCQRVAKLYMKAPHLPVNCNVKSLYEFGLLKQRNAGYPQIRDTQCKIYY